MPVSLPVQGLHLCMIWFACKYGGLPIFVLQFKHTNITNYMLNKHR
ncbi:hypothetical protein HanPSC8_Chr10g0422021 [Helianthus annuus]|nr:hypothetical protein HanPSC8_Chr10g0422021 [Helianthus annuus]